MRTAAAFSGAIQEEDIPTPEIHYTLPAELTGDFIILAGLVDKQLTIFPSNKYVIRSQSWDHSSSEYGYITQRSGVFYFQPIDNRNVLSVDTRIFLNGDSFYFIGKNPSYGTPYYENYLYTVIHSKPVIIDSVAADVSILQREAERSYFIWRSPDGGSLEMAW
jgi:hypothetical protein